MRPFSAIPALLLLVGSSTDLLFAQHALPDLAIQILGSGNDVPAVATVAFSNVCDSIDLPSYVIAYEGQVNTPRSLFPENCDWVFISVRSLGYRLYVDTVATKQLREGPDLKIQLNQQIEELAQAEVRARRYRSYRVDGQDTTSYRASEMNQPTGARLSDLLENIPGTEVNPSTGEVRVGGAAIETLLFDGEDVTNGDYGAVSRSLAANEIEQVEIIRNWKANPRLGFLEPGDQVAVNLVLADKESTIGGTLSASAGARRPGTPVAQVSPFAHRLRGSGLRGTLTGGYDATGLGVDEIVTLSTEDRQDREKRMYHFDPPRGGDLRAFRSEDLDVWPSRGSRGLVKPQALWVVSPQTRVRGGFTYAREGEPVDFRSGVQTLRVGGASAPSITATGRVRRREASAQLEVESWLTDELYLQAQLSSEFAGYGEPATKVRDSNSAVPFRSEYADRSLTNRAALDVAWVTSQKSTFLLALEHHKISSEVSFASTPADGQADPASIAQEFRGSLHTTRADVAYVVGQPRRHWHFGVQADGVHADPREETELQGLPPFVENSDSISRRSSTFFAIGPYARYQMQSRTSRFDVRLRPTLTLLSNNAGEAQVGSDGTAFDILGELRFATVPSDRHKIDVELERRVDVPSEVAFRGLSYYRSSFLGIRIDPSPLMMRTSTAKVSYRLQPSFGGEFRISLKGLTSRGGLVPLPTFFDNIAGLSLLSDNRHIFGSTARLHYTGRVKPLRCTVSPSATFQTTSYPSIDNQVTTSHTRLITQNLALGFSARFRIGSFVINPLVRRESSSLRDPSSPDSAPALVLYSGSVRLQYAMPDRFDLSTNVRTSFFPGVSTFENSSLSINAGIFISPRLTVRIEATNLLNTRSIRAFGETGETLLFTSESLLRPTQIVVGGRFDF